MTDDLMNNRNDEFSIPSADGGEDEMPDWLKDMAPAEPPAPNPAPEPGASDELESEEVPAWLRELTPRTLPPALKPAAAQAPSSDLTAAVSSANQPTEQAVSELPKETANRREVEAASEPPVAEAKSAEEPAFAPIVAESHKTPGNEFLQALPPPFAATALPDWLSELAPQADETTDASQVSVSGLEQEGIPAWLTKLTPPSLAAPIGGQSESGAPSGAEGQTDIAAKTSSEPDLGPNAAGQAGGERTESIERDTHTAPQPAPATPQVSTVTDVESEAASPDWIHELKPSPTVQEPRAGSKTRQEEWEREELPDWLREEPAIYPEAKRAAKAPGGTGIEEGAPVLTGTFRPPTGEELPEVTETSGPLSGIRGVLPIAYDLTQPYGEPKAGPSRPSGARMFESVLSRSAAATSVAPSIRADRTARPWVNFGIYLVVFLAALIALFMPRDIAGLGLTVNNQTPTAAFYDALKSLQPGQTVLLAFDYEIGQTVELDPAARAIVGDLARRQINVMAVSTSLVGAQIAQGLLLDVARENPNWQRGTNFVNVGYIPGAESGLRGLEQNWLPSAQLDFEKQRVNGLPLGQRIKGLKDVALVIELAGSDQVLRWWMEQVQPHSAVPIVSAVSASVEPSARNYRNAKQLTAFLRGLQGAAEYELFSNQPALSVHVIDAQSFTQLLLVGIIVLSNLVFWFGHFQRTRAEKAAALPH